MEVRQRQAVISLFCGIEVVTTGQGTEAPGVAPEIGQSVTGLGAADLHANTVATTDRRRFMGE